jgi:hypothetical protein
MGNSSPGTPTSSSPDRLHPCHVDDSELSADARAGNWCAMLPAMFCVLLAMPPMIVMLAVMDRWRAWRGTND